MQNRPPVSPPGPRCKPLHHSQSGGATATNSLKTATGLPRLASHPPCSEALGRPVALFSSLPALHSVPAQNLCTGPSLPLLVSHFSAWLFPTHHRGLPYTLHLT